MPKRDAGHIVLQHGHCCLRKRQKVAARNSNPGRHGLETVHAFGLQIPCYELCIIICYTSFITYGILQITHTYIYRYYHALCIMCYAEHTGNQFTQAAVVSQPRPDTVSFNAAITVCARARRWQLAVQLFSDMPRVAACFGFPTGKTFGVGFGQLSFDLPHTSRAWTGGLPRLLILMWSVPSQQKSCRCLP